MSMMVSFVLSFFPRDVLDEILNLIESVSEDFPSYSCSHSHNDAPNPQGGFAERNIHSCTNSASMSVLYCYEPFQCGFNHAAVFLLDNIDE